MADQPSVPTFYANLVTGNMTSDDLTMELRRFDRAHSETVNLEKPGDPFTIIPPPTPAEIVAIPPVARVVVTYTAARMLKNYLDLVLPRAEQARKAGTGIA